MYCVVCGIKSIGTNHKCSPQSIIHYKRSMAAKQRYRELNRRYGAGETVGDRIAAGTNFLRGSV